MQEEVYALGVKLAKQVERSISGRPMRPTNDAATRYHFIMVSSPGR